MPRGEELYQLLRSRLYRRLPMLALPLGLLDWHDCNGKPGCDGRFFYASVSWLEAAAQKNAPDGGVLLHSVLHAMLGHPWTRGGRDEARWTLACDMTAVFLQHRLLSLPMEGDVAKAYYVCRNGTQFSARSVYDQLCGGFPLSLDALRDAFTRDSHSFWTRNSARQRRSPGIGDGDGAELAALWARQTVRLSPYLQPDRPKIGSGTANQRLMLRALPENNTRFAALLRAFSVVRENRHVSDSDFSYSWYAYSMAHYDGAVLLEPLEYSEERKLRELVIVLDTSASCSRGIVEQFLAAVHAIVCREQLFFERFRLHIIQCDCTVQQDTLVTTLDEFQWYLDHLALYGGGGTDFRPAFSHIDALVASGELPQLGGVLYFTDGYGVFPPQPPEYPVAFVMLQYRYDDINIPRWAMKLVLDADKPGRDERWI